MTEMWVFGQRPKLREASGCELGCALVSRRNFAAPSPSLTTAPRSRLRLLHYPDTLQAILREIDVAHPAAKSMLELARSQDEEVGDGTTSVIILAGELLVVAEPFLVRNMHPTVIVRAYSA